MASGLDLVRPYNINQSEINNVKMNVLWIPGKVFVTVSILSSNTHLNSDKISISRI